MTGWAPRVLRGLVAVAGSTVVVLTVSAQLAPGWQPAPTESSLAPAPAPAVEDPGTRPVQQTAAEVAGTEGPLRAWITRPVDTATDGSGVPGVVLVPGSGTTSRDAHQAEAETLAAAGLAVIRVDKPASYSFVNRDFDALAADTAAAAEVLAASPGVDGDRIGVLGFSEGGWVAPRAPQRAPDRFAFVVLVSAPVVSPLEQMGWTLDRAVSAWPDPLRRVLATMNASGRELLPWISADVRPALAQLRVPTLAVFGADDATVPVATATRRLQSAVTGAPLTVQIVDDAGHGVPAQAYVAQVAALARSGDAGPGGVVGVEPASHLGVAPTPVTRWFHHPGLQLGFSLVVGLVAAALPVRRRRRTTTRLDLQSARS